MALKLLLLMCLVPSSLSVIVSAANRTGLFSLGDYRLCLDQTSDNVNMFEVLPGGGWDNLQNKDRGYILDTSYFQCKTTEDRKYLLPDFVTTVPNKMSEISTFAQMFTHWSQYKSITSSSVNVDAGVTFEEGTVSGKFGDDYQHVKENQIKHKSFTTHVQLRYNRYKAELQPGFPLRPSFKSRLLSIASNLQSNRQEEARFESQLLVREYGTHIITGIDAGAVLAKDVFIDETIFKTTDITKTQISAAASATFFGLAKFDTSFTHSVSNEHVQAFTDHTTTSKVYSYGGPVFRTSNFTPDDWLKGIDNNLVAVDRTGDPIYFYITPESLPELQTSSVYLVRRAVEDAVTLYYKFNTYRGCTDPDSQNFSPSANLDDRNCKKAFTKVHFGGVYQTCKMTDLNSGNICSDDKLDQLNPLTGSHSCPANFQPVPATSGTVNKQWVEHSCHRCWLVFHCCHDIQHTSTATYEGYWCSASTNETGYFFGGLYTSKVGNLFTGAHSCPPYYIPLRLGTDLSICVSEDGDMGPPSSIPLGGFFTCSTGNPLASSSKTSSQWPKQCPSGYSIHVATADQGCSINYCLVSETFRNVDLKIIRRPPYTRTPVLPPSVPSFSLFDSASNKWMKDNEAVDFIRRNIPNASNLKSNDIIRLSSIDMTSVNGNDLQNALNQLRQASTDPSDVNEEKVDTPAGSSIHPASRKWRSSRHPDDVQNDSSDAANATSHWVIVGSVVVVVGFFLTTLTIFIRLRKKRRSDYVPIPTNNTD